MKFALIFSSLAAAVYAQTINTPESVLSCANHQVTFTGGTPPYTILVVPGGDTSGAALETFAGVPCSPYTWFVTEAAGTSVFLRLQDASGASVSTAPFTIQAGTNNGTCVAPTTSAAAGSCAAASTAAGGSSGGATSAPAAGGATTTAGSGAGTTTPAPTGTGSGSGSGSGSTTHATTSATTTHGAGFTNQVGVAGVIVSVVAMGLAALA